MIKYTYVIIVLFFGLSVNLVNEQSIENYNVTQRIDSLYTELFKYGEFNGNILVAHEGKEIYAKSFGISDSDKNIPLQRNSIFYLASVSKQFTAFSIFLLQKQGKLSFDDAISKYLPQLHHYNDIKIKHLVYHTSGLADYLNLFNDEKYDSSIITNNDVINLLEATKPKVDFEPGEKFDYSNTGYLLLASIVESVTNQKFETFLDERIFEPLKMNNTRLLMYDDIDANWKDEQIAKAYYEYPEDEELFHKYKGVYGQAKIYSTVDDLLKWDRALKENTLISQEDTDFIFSPGVLNSGEKTRYGFGWFLKDEEPYGKFVYHSGYFPGYLTYISRHIEKGYTIILLQNNDNRTGKTRLPSKDTRNIIYNLPLEKDIRLQDTILQKYAGTYITEKGDSEEIKLLHQSLWTNSDFELVPINNTKFRVNGFSPEVTYTFNLNDDGSVKSYRVQQIKQGVDKTSIRKK